MNRFYQLLQWSEKYAKTDMTYLAKGGFWLLQNQIISFVFSLLLLWVFANFLSKDTYGEYRFITTVAALLSVSCLSGMGIALTNAVARGNPGILLPLVRLRMKWGLVGSTIALIGAGYYFLNDDPRLAILFLLISVTVPFIEPLTSHQHYLNGLKDFKLYSLLRTGQRASVVFFTIGAILFTENIVYIVATFFLSTIISDAIALRIAAKKYPAKETYDASVVRYGNHLSVMSTMRLVVQYLDKVVLWYFAGPIAVASYVVAVSIPQEMTSGCAQIAKLALPKMAAKSKAELRQSLLRKTTIFAISITPLIVLYALAAPLLFDTLFPQYNEVVLYSQIASIMVIFAATSLFSQYFYATENKRALYYQNIVEPVTLLALYAILIPTFGVMGAIVATLARHVMVSLVWIWLFLLDKH